MPVVVNEVHTEVHAFDASALLTDEVLRVIDERVAAAIARRASADVARARDIEIRDARRRVD